MKIKALPKKCRTVFFIIAIILISFTLEAFVANFPYISYSLFTKKDFEAEGDVLSPKFEGELKISKTKREIRLNDLKTPVWAVSFDTKGNPNTSYGVSTVSVKIQDENVKKTDISAAIKPTLVKADTVCTNTLYLKSSGKVDSLALVFSESDSFTVTSIRINSDYKFQFNFVRFFVILSLLLSLYLFSRLNFRRESLSELTLERKRLLAVFLCLVSVIVALVMGCLLAYGGTETEYPLEKSVNNYNNPYVQQYDAFKKGQLHFDYEPSDKFLELEDPYNVADRTGHYYLWDRAFYDGKYYSYFGIAPILTVYAPYELLTGSLPSDSFVTVTFTVIAALFFTLTVVAYVWIHKIKIPVTMLILSIPSGLFGTCMFLIARGYAPYYYIAVLSSMAFFFAFAFCSVVAFSRKRGSASRYVWLALSSLSFSLLFLSRMNLALGAAVCIIPALFIFIVFNRDGRSAKRVLLELLALGSVVLATLIFTFVYNYLRFDSIFEFGTKYQLTVSDVSYNTFELSDLFFAVYHYILSQFDFSPTFPFFGLKYAYDVSYGNYLYSDVCFGVLAIPLCLALFYGICVFKDREVRKSSKLLLSAGLFSLLCVAALNLSMGGVIFRYSADLTAIAVPMSLFLLFGFYERVAGIEHNGETLLCAEAEKGGTEIRSAQIPRSSRESTAYTVCTLLLLATFAVCALVTISRNANLTVMPAELFGRIFNFLVFWR